MLGRSVCPSPNRRWATGRLSSAICCSDRQLDPPLPSGFHESPWPSSVPLPVTATFVSPWP